MKKIARLLLGLGILGAGIGGGVALLGAIITSTPPGVMLWSALPYISAFVVVILVVITGYSIADNA